MACTIDHLRADHAVRVLRNFTDARGRSHRAGETAVVRQMGFDSQAFEIWIDWEQQGVVARLYFSLRTATGPGNGRMREYFELGEDAPVSAPPLPAVTKAEDAPPARPRGKAFPGRHPAAETQLGEVAVACDCDPAMHRAVLIEFTGVNACLRCGTVTCTRSVGDDGRFTGDSWQAFIAVAVSQEVLEWLAQWPRMQVRRHLSHRWPMADGLGRRDVIHLPAETRCETAAELVALEDRILLQRRPVEFPAEKPPVELTGSLRAYGQFWAALPLSAQRDLTQLVPLADFRHPASGVVVERLLRRSDVFEVMVDALRNPDGATQSAGVALARAARPIDPRLPGVLIGILEGLPLTLRADAPDRIVSWSRYEELLVVIGDLQLGTPEMIATLKAQQRRLARLDSDLVRAIGIILRELSGAPPAESAPYLP